MLQNKTHTTWNRLNGAVVILAKGTSSLQDRLHHVYWHQLSSLNQQNFPQNLQADFAQLKQQLIARVAAKENAQTMSDEEAMELSTKIVSIYDTVARKHCS